ncbi:MAG TPA: VWA domain-containing protein [Thermoanaerobaculia bacterium]
MRKAHLAASLAALLLACALPLAAQAPEEQDSFGETIEVNVINVEAYVTDASGRRVKGLQRGDFELREDGKPVEIVNFAAFDQEAPAASAPVGSPSAAPSTTAVVATAADPMHLVVFVDNFNIRPANRSRVLRQLDDFLGRRLAAGDRVMLVTYDLGLNVRLPFTSDRTALTQALAGLEKLTANGAENERARRAALEHILTIQERAIANQRLAGRLEEIGERGARGREELEDEATEFAQVEPLCPMDIVQPAKSYAEAARQEALRTVTAMTVLVNSLSGLPGRKTLLLVSDGVSVTPGEELFQALYELCGGGGTGSGLAGSQLNQSATNAVDAQALGRNSYRASQAMIDAQAYSTAKNWSALAAHANSHRVTLYALQATGVESATATSSDMGPEDRVLQLSSVSSIERTNRQGSLSVLAADTGGRAVFNANDLAPELARIEEDFGTYYSLGYSPSHQGDGREHRIEVRVKRPGLRVRHRQSYRDKPPLERAVDRTLAALFYGFEDNPLEIGVEIGETTPASGSAFAVPVRLRIPIAKLGLEVKDNAYRGKLRLLVATRGPSGGNSPVRQVEVPISIPLSQGDATMNQVFVYEIKLQLPAGGNQVAIAVRDDITTLTSYLSRNVQVGGEAAQAPAR